jgi:hypothetical protein
LAEPVAAKGVLPNLGRQGGPQGVAVQEVIERGVGDLPGGFVVDGAADRGGELSLDSPFRVSGGWIELVGGDRQSGVGA